MGYAELKPRLAKSKFRSRFKLNDKDRAYIASKGWTTVTEQARRIIVERLAPAFPEKDGKQTPMRGHVVFSAQHATATCCRGCLFKWHNIPKEQPLTEAHINYIVEVIIDWLKDKAGDFQYPETPDLFDF